MTDETYNDSDETYNDWANKPTQIIHQYIINNPSLCDAATRVVVAAYDGWAAPDTLADYTAPDDGRGVTPSETARNARTDYARDMATSEALADYFEEAIAESTVHASSLGLLTLDLLLDTLGRVDWRDIALALMMDIDE
jgi:hypothetical protein